MEVEKEAVSAGEARRSLARLLLRLGSKDTADRWTAQTELRGKAPVPTELLLPPLIRLARMRQQSPFLLFAGLLTAGALTLGLLLVFDGLFGRVSHVPVLLAGIACFALVVRRWLRLRGVAARVLLNFNDVRLVGPLLDELGSPDRETRQVTRELLSILLPRLRPNDAEGIEAARHARLLALLDERQEPLTLAVLKALAQIDTGEALPRLRQLAKDSSTTPQVREAAQSGMNEIAARQIQKRLSRNLLRML